VRSSFLVVMAFPLIVGAAVAGTASEVALPQTIERVWYRANADRGAGSQMGDLTVGREGLSFAAAHERKSFTVPLEAVHSVWLGRVRGDVDTDWVVLVLDEAGERRVVAFRDGKGLGYGQRTQEIHAALRDAMRVLGAAQYRVPEGFVVFDDLDGLFTVAYPQGWTVYHDVVVEAGRRRVLGRLYLTDGPSPRGEEERVTLVRGLEGGSIQGVFVERDEVGGGMRCSGATARARDKWLARVAADPLFTAPGAAMDGAPSVEPVTIEGCSGLRVGARGRDAAGLETMLDILFVADDQAAYAVGFRSRSSDHAARLPTFARILDTLRLSAARPGR